MPLPSWMRRLVSRPRNRRGSLGAQQRGREAADELAPLNTTTLLHTDGDATGPQNAIFSPPVQQRNQPVTYVHGRHRLLATGQLRPPARGQLPVRGRVGPSDFDVVSLLGDGTFGIVYLVRKRNGRDAGVFYAAKQMEKPTRHCLSTNLRQEARILRHITQWHNPFVPTLYYSFRTDTHLNLVMEFIAGETLYDFALKRKQPSDVIKRIMAEIVTGVKLLHDQGIVVCDLKPENIMLNNKGHVKLLDFGLAYVLDIGRNQIRTDKFHGTPGFMAPETCYHDSSTYSAKSDWFATGAVFYWLKAQTSLVPQDDLNVAKDLFHRGDLSSAQYVGQVLNYTTTAVVDTTEHIRQQLVRSRARFGFAFEEEPCVCYKCRSFINGHDDATPAYDFLVNLTREQPAERWGWHQLSSSAYFVGVDFYALAAGQLGAPIVDDYRFAVNDPRHFADDKLNEVRGGLADDFYGRRPSQLDDNFASFSFENERAPTASEQAREFSVSALARNLNLPPTRGNAGGFVPFSALPLEKPAELNAGADQGASDAAGAVADAASFGGSLSPVAGRFDRHGPLRRARRRHAPRREYVAPAVQNWSLANKLDASDSDEV